MRLPIALLLISSFTACASKDGFIDNQVNMCDSGQVIEMQVGFDQGAYAPAQRMEERYTLLVEVSNNSHEDITVKTIRAQPGLAERNATIEFQGGYREFGSIVKEGESSMFEIPITARTLQGDPRDLNDPSRQRRTVIADLTVTVELSDGESYRCRFRVPLDR